MTEKIKIKTEEKNKKICKDLFDIVPHDNILKIEPHDKHIIKNIKIDEDNNSIIISYPKKIIANNIIYLEYKQNTKNTIYEICYILASLSYNEEKQEHTIKIFQRRISHFFPEVHAKLPILRKFKLTNLPNPNPLLLENSIKSNCGFSKENDTLYLEEDEVLSVYIRNNKVRFIIKIGIVEMGKGYKSFSINLQEIASYNTDINIDHIMTKITKIYIENLTAHEAIEALSQESKYRQKIKIILQKVKTIHEIIYKK